MATLFDMSIVGQAKVVFTFLLVYVVAWGFLTWRKPLGDKNQTVYAMISLAMAFFVVISKSARALIEFITPWFLFLVILIFFIIFFVMMFGVGEKSIEVLIKDSTVYTLLLIVVAVIVIFGLVNSYGQKSLEATQGTTSMPSTYVTPDGGETIVPATVEEGGVFVQSSTPVAVPGASGYGAQPQPGEPGATNTGDYTLNLINTLLHPKIVSIGVIFLLATFIVYFLTRPQWI